MILYKISYHIRKSSSSSSLTRHSMGGENWIHRFFVRFAFYAFLLDLCCIKAVRYNNTLGDIIHLSTTMKRDGIFNKKWNYTFWGNAYNEGSFERYINTTLGTLLNETYEIVYYLLLLTNKIISKYFLLIIHSFQFRKPLK